MARFNAVISSPLSRLRRTAVTTAGDPKAMTLLGELYANGLGVPQDYQRAAEWYRLAAARGYDIYLTARQRAHPGSRSCGLETKAELRSNSHAGPNDQPNNKRRAS